jgi:cellulose synthase/poly-beta-1,6-N-acetylglucosamine synthase-like glycosyltransferase
MPFSDKNIGFVSGELRYLNQKKTKITQSASIYWKYEKFLRKLESELRLFVFGTGACCAVRRKLYKPIPLTGDIDFTTPLDVVLQGYICISQNVAIAWDEMPDTQKKEFKSRVRMTSKNLYGTIARWGVLGVFKYPAYSFVIFSHKIGRWLTPFAMIGVFVGSLLVPNNLFIFLLLVAQFLFYSLAVFGYYRFPFPLSGLIYSFCLTNIGFFIGVMKAITGQVPQAYKPINKV